MGSTGVCAVERLRAMGIGHAHRAGYVLTDPNPPDGRATAEPLPLQEVCHGPRPLQEPTNAHSATRGQTQTSPSPPANPPSHQAS